jgi:hypothetical protein
MVAAALLSIAGVAHAAAAGTDAGAVLAPVRQRIETADYRATGQLVKVDAGGKRTAYALSIKARFFSGALHTLLEIDPPSGTAAKMGQDGRVRILLELRPNGEASIRVVHPHETAATALPVEKWGDGLFGGGFSYEDFLEPQYYWHGQAIGKGAKFGARDCDVLKSTPGAGDHSHYADVETWLDHSIGFPVYAEKTEKDGAVKQVTYLGLRQTSGVWSASQVEVKTRGKAGSTLLIVKRGSAKANLSAKEFSPEQIGHFEDRP